MARINTYTRDKKVDDEDILLGSAFEGNSQSGPVYKTQSYKIGDLAKYLNLVFTVDEVNYNLNDMILRIEGLEEFRDNFQNSLGAIQTHVTDNYSISLDTSGNFSGIKALGDLAPGQLNFTTTSFRFYDEIADLSVEPFHYINNGLKLKREYIQLSYDDIIDLPELIVTIIYADNADGDNQSLSATGKEYYAIYKSVQVVEESDLPITGLTWFRIEGKPGENAVVVKLLSNQAPFVRYDIDLEETQDFVFTAQTQNTTELAITYKFTVNGVEVQTSASNVYALPDSLEPIPGGVTTVGVQLLNGGIELAGVADYISVIGTLEDSGIVYYILDNEADLVLADNDGDPVDPTFSINGGNSIVVFGIEDITDQCTFSVVSETGVDVTINSNTGVYYINSMSADIGKAVFRATIPGSVINSDVDLVRDKVYTVSKVIKGPSGLEGEPGSDSKSVALLPSRTVIAYDEYGVRKVGNDLTLVANSAGYTFPQYKWLKDGISIINFPGSGVTEEWSYEDTYIVPEALLVPPLATDDWEVQVREANPAVSTEISTDIQTIGGIQDKSDAIYVDMSNEAVTLTTSLAGNVNYNGSENSIRVYKGGELLIYTTTTPLTPNKFTVAVNGINITPGAITGNTTTQFNIGLPSNMLEDNAEIEFTITVYNLPENIVFTRKQSFSKAKQGPIGETIIGPEGQRTVSGILWYDTGVSTRPDTPVPFDSAGSPIVYDFDNQIFVASPPPDWQEDSPEGIPGTAESIYWTSRYTITENIGVDGNPTGFGTPVFALPIRALVFNQVVVFQSDEPNNGYTQIDGGYIKTLNIRSINYNAPDAGETFADSGMLIDLQNSKITSKNLVLDDNGLIIKGDGEFTGNLTGASGTFGPVTINSSGISSTNFTIASNGNVTFNGSGTFSGSVTASGGAIGGWNIDSSSIYSGTKDTSGFTSNGITISSAGGGSIHAENFYIDTNGNAAFKGDISGANLGDNFNFDNGKITVVSGAGGTTNAGIIEFVQPAPGYAQDGYIYSSITDGYRGLAIYSVDYTKIIGDLFVSGDITGFEADINGSGYQKLHSGIIIQWINGSGTTPNATTGPGPYGNWPVTFPNACFGAVVSKGIDQGNQTISGGYPTFQSDSNAATVSFSKNMWHVDTNEGSNSRDFFIIAIGY